jgi:hypothetical protein
MLVINDIMHCSNSIRDLHRGTIKVSKELFDRSNNNQIT